ncbi:MAG: dihydrolipoamide acetyltransferase family protein [Salinarimonas sp.]
MGILKMPSLGADMEEATLIEWLVAPGAAIARGDVVAVVETQKGAIEIECFEAGELSEIMAREGETLPVGAPLARIGEVGDRETEEAVEQRPGAIEPPPEEKPATLTPPPAPSPVSQGLLASPAARQRAGEAGIVLKEIAGSGPGGAVLLADVEAAISAAPVAREKPAAKAPAGKTKPGLDMAEMRKAIAAAMSRAKREIPHYYLTHEIDLQDAADRLAAANATRIPDERVLMGALLIRATIRAAAAIPEMNGHYADGAFTPAQAVHCGIGIALRGGGLIAPAIRDAQDHDPDGLMAAMRDLVRRTRTGRLRNSEVTTGTITVSALGETGVDALFGVIYPPQVALVGFGTPRLRPVVREGRVEPRLCVTASLAADHRVSDGRTGARFLALIAQHLQESEEAEERQP